MRFILILFTGLSLSACAETGNLLGTITMIPVKVLSRGVSYDQSSQKPEIINDINQASPLHAQ